MFDVQNYRLQKVRTMVSLYRQIFEANISREQAHEGEKQTCMQCGASGIVGSDLVAMANVSGSEVRFGWIHHEGCQEERMVGEIIEL